MIKYTAIVLAAGQGKRMGAGHNKQFININDKPLVLHTLAVFERDTWCEEIILVTNEQEREQMEALLERFPSSTPIRAVGWGSGASGQCVRRTFRCAPSNLSCADS